MAVRTLVEYLVQKRNPHFRLDASLDNRMLLSFMAAQTGALARGLMACVYGRSPKWMLRGKGVSFSHVHNIQWGRFLKLGDHVHISALGKHHIRFGNNVGIGALGRIIISTSLNNLGSHISIGNNVGIGEFAYLGGGGGLEIGDNCIIGQYFSCHPENHRFGAEDLLIKDQGVTRKGIRIGDNCWIGAKVTILDGVEIGSGCVIAAGAVVNKSFPANSIIGGVPAKLIGQVCAHSSPIKAIA